MDLFSNKIFDSFISILLVVFLILISTTINVAQNTCHTDEAYHIQLLKTPNLKSQIDQQEQLLLQFERNHSTNRSIIVLPIVVHIIRHESDPLITESSILDQLNQLNLDFNGLNTSYNIPAIFKDKQANVGIKFCLAHRNEMGDPALGIEQKTTFISYFGDKIDDFGNRQLKYDQLGGYQAWNTELFINIWVSAFETISGEASFPGTADIDNDGIMIDINHFGKNHRTLTHEMGHYLNLKHLWGTTIGCENGDLVEDTPEQEYPYFGCPSHPQISCGSADMFMNFMDYSEDNCLSFFTKGQMNRMHNSISLWRNNLLNSNYCQSDNHDFSLQEDLYISHHPGYITVHYKYIPQDVISMDIYNAQGKYIRSEKSVSNRDQEINLRGYPIGVYFIVFNYNNKKLTEKILLVR